MGPLLASASIDAEEVRIWNARNCSLLQVLKGRVYSLAWHPDGKRLAGGGGDAFRSQDPGEVFVWDARRRAGPVSPHGPQSICFKGRVES